MTTKQIERVTFYDEATEKYYTIKNDFDYSVLCDLVDDEDLQEIEETNWRL